MIIKIQGLDSYIDTGFYDTFGLDVATKKSIYVSNRAAQLIVEVFEADTEEQAKKELSRLALRWNSIDNEPFVFVDDKFERWE